MRSDSMRAVVITGPNKASLQEVGRMVPVPGEVLVRCHTAAICTAERRVFSGHMRYYPMIGGHEFTGTVERVDGLEIDLDPGDRVAIDASTRCGRCYYCVKGRNNQCVKMFEFRHDYDYYQMGGGFGEYVALRPSQMIKLADHVDLEEASVLEPLACCIHSLKRAQIRFGETVLVIGAGTMGGMHVMLAKLAGASVIVSDIDPVRLAQAGQLGADRTVNPETEDLVAVVKDLTAGRGADGVIVAASSRGAGEQGLRCVGRTGRLVFYASLHPSGMLDLDWNRVHYEEIVITGTEGHTDQDFHEAVALVSNGSVSVRPLISRVISLEELPAELGSRPAGETQRVVVRL